MTSWRHPLAIAVASLITLCALMCLSVPRADAKARYTSPYTLSQNYSAALRLIRVDHGFEIVERDPDAAYIMFKYESHESGSRVTPGAIEMVPRRDHVQVFVKLPKMPRYHEEVMKTELERKLKEEYGEPPERPEPEPPEEEPDAGAGEDAGSS